MPLLDRLRGDEKDEEVAGVNGLGNSPVVALAGGKILPIEEDVMPGSLQREADAFGDVPLDRRIGEEYIHVRPSGDGLRLVRHLR